MKFGCFKLTDTVGAILAHSVRHKDGVFKKGRIISETDIAIIAASGCEEIFVAILQPGDVPEDEAAQRISQVIAGVDTRAQAPFTGRANILAQNSGLALIDRDRVQAINRLHESLTIATVTPYEHCHENQMLATVKIIPFAMPETILKQALTLIGKRPLIDLAGFLPLRVGLVITTVAGMKPKMVEKTQQAMAQRLAALGAQLVQTKMCNHDTASVAAEVKALDCDLILLFGASAIVDRGDVVPAGLVAAGGKVMHLGMPVDPGNLLMLGKFHDKPVIGVPSCARSLKLNGFDWVLLRLMAGIKVRPQDVMDMGAGGLLKEIINRPAPREGTPASSAQVTAKITAVILAAGQSSRMGVDNKLVCEIAGKPIIRCTVEAVLHSSITEIIVVTGCDDSAVKMALDGLDVRYVDNPNYADGLAGSVKTGIAALSGNEAGALIVLGDMPLVAATDIERLIAAFNPAEDRAIIVPSHDGKRGNPVLWGAEFFSSFGSLSGDEGAKSLMMQNGEKVCEVAMEDLATLSDVDTPEALAKIRAVLDL